MKRRLYQQADEGGKLAVDLSLRDDGSIEVFFYDVGLAAEEAFGDSDYEVSLTIGAEQLGQLCFALLADRFSGNMHALSEIQAYCEANEIETKKWSY